MSSGDFDIKYKEAKGIASALENLEKVSRKSMLAVQQVGAAVHALMISLRELDASGAVGSSPTAANARSYVQSAANSMRSFNEGPAFASFNNGLLHELTPMSRQLSEEVQKLRHAIKEGKEAEEKMCKYAKKQATKGEKHRQYTILLGTRRQEVERCYARLTTSRHKFLPKMVYSVLHHNYLYTHALQQALKEAATLQNAVPADAPRVAANVSGTSLPLDASTSSMLIMPDHLRNVAMRPERMEADETISDSPPTRVAQRRSPLPVYVQEGPAVVRQQFVDPDVSYPPPQYGA